MFAGWKSRAALGLLFSSMAVAFENPIRAPAPDPSLVTADGIYYLYGAYCSPSFAVIKSI
jgi:hypothetical protein